MSFLSSPLARPLMGGIFHFLQLAFLSLLITSAHVQGQSGPASASPPAAGQLSRIPIFLEASGNLLDSIPIPSPQTRWSIPEAEAFRAKEFFTEGGLSPAVAEALTSPGASVRADGWVHYFPGSQFVRDLPREIRSKLYGMLAKFPVNEFQESPVLILSDTVEEWYQKSRLPPELVEEITAMAYKRGKVWAFSDVPLLISKAKSEDELRDIVKHMTRTRAYLVRLSIGPETDVTSLKRYWRPVGIGFRRKDVEPLLESLKETGAEVNLDLVHMLPPLPRKLLYSYPGPENASQGILPDCHWTSLNYFNYDPHGYLLDSALATAKVLKDYEPVNGSHAYGDILFFVDKVTGDAFHSCVYLAEDLVFTKNGRNQMAPWIISTLEDISRIYLSSREGFIQGYRKRRSDDS